MMIDPEEIMIEDILSWFPEFHSTMWGQTFTIADGDRAVVAAEWFRSQMISFSEHMMAGEIEEELEKAPVTYPVLLDDVLRRQAATYSRKIADSTEDQELDILITSAIWPPPPVTGTGIGNPAKVTS